MAARYELKRSRDQKYYWTLQADNNEVLLTSETYASKGNAENGVASAKRNSSSEGNYDRRNASNTQYYFVLRAGNNEVLGTSEMYTTAWARDNGITACKQVGPKAPTSDLT